MVSLSCFSLPTTAAEQPLNIKQPLKLADQGHVEAQVFVTDSYYMGRNGFPQNDSLALQYYQAAAKQNNASAQFALVTMYLEGEGTAVNKQLAFDFLNKAATTLPFKIEHVLPKCPLSIIGFYLFI